MNSRPSSIVSRAGSRRRWFPPALALVLPLIASMPGVAAERVWDGGAPVNIGWTDAANWVTRGLTPTAPAAGDDLRFPAGALKPSNNNNFPVGTSFNLLTYAGAGYTASGNEIGLTGGIVVSHGAGNTVLNLPINIALNQTFTVSVAGANLFLNGAVDLVGTRPVLTFDGAGQTVVVGNISDSRVGFGGGTIRKNGAGTLYVLQNLTFGGPTIVNGGTLIMDGRMSNSAVTVNASATLRGTGKVGGLTVNSGGTVSPGQNSPDILDSLGDMALNAGSTFNVRLNGTNVGLNYDQLKVQGAVTLGGTLNVTAGFTAAVGDTFTLIENDGDDDVVGTFAGLPERAILMINGRPFQISYGGRGGLGGVFGRDVNDVTLEAVPALSVWDGGGNQNKFWSEPLNWVGDVVPMPGDDIQFSSSGSGTLITSNNFPAGRAVGSMVFIGGIHLVGGNLAQINGGIQVNAGSDLDEPFRHVDIAMPLVLGANQTFEVNNPKAVLFTDAPIDLADHNLTVESHVTYSYVSTEHSQITIRGGIGGQGTLIKNGPGNLSFLSPSTCAHTIVNGGSIHVNESGLSPITGSVTVNAGAALDTENNIGGDVTVNPAGVLRVYSGTVGGNVEINGGTFQASPPSAFHSVTGNLHMVNGSTYGVAVWQDGSVDYPSFNGARVRGTVELADCALNLSVATDVVPGNLISILSHTDNGRTGTFAGLPDGSRFAAGGHIFTIWYAPRDVILVADKQFTWDGGGGGNIWTTAANWVGDFAPFANLDLDLIFPAGVSKVGTINDFAPGTTFRSLTFGAPNYVVAGNSFRLTQRLNNDFASGETVIHPSFTMSGDSHPVYVGNASRLRLEGTFTGNTSWKKTGTGTLRFGGTGANTQNLVEVWAGELELGKSPGVTAISTRLQVGDGTNVAAVTWLDDHQIADDAWVTVNAPARLELNGNFETIGYLDGDGTVALSERFFRAGRLTLPYWYFSGSITGGGGLTVIGPDSVALTGTNTYSGMTILSGGELHVEGVQTNSAIRLDGGLLRGRGHVGTITGNLGGGIQPGFNGASFQNRLHSRDVAFNSSTTFRPLLTSSDPGFENSQLQVSGAASLGGCALDIELRFVPSAGRSFKIIDNDGADAVVGTFAGLPEGAQFTRTGLTWRITYAGGDGNDVVLTLLAVDFRTVITSFTVDLESLPGQERATLTATGVPRAVYDVQRSTNLLDWTLLFSRAPDENGIIDLRFSSPMSGPQRYYRLKLR